ncbi:MAG TPA: hypothetical protein VFR90_13375 [Methylibium sp.]|uniref:hypothetical protein n=1 Tax=Methylibium sp. TaxID=2067992 RepID=UPI002DB5EB86|nr:hypothetical protein [Methylibium sp.]HEU4460107.1 hypothetical protein [Methylibium sp.]
MKRTLVLAIPALFLAACASPPPVVRPELQYVEVPPLNSVATAEIGETLVAKGKLYVFDGLELQERITDNGFAREYYIEPSAMRLERIDEAGNQYFLPPMDSYFVNDKTFGRRVRPSNAYLVRKKDGALELIGYYDLTSAGKISPAQPRHKVGKVIDRKQPNFRQELLYGGRVGNQIKLTYREFSDDFVRPGFAQEAQYDLGADQTIGFKGARIQVLEATNTTLKYKVLKSFPDVP